MYKSALNNLINGTFPTNIKNVLVKGDLPLSQSMEIEVNKKEIKKMNLNNSQEKALINAVTYPFSLVQGPPGTDKSHFILSLITYI